MSLVASQGSSKLCLFSLACCVVSLPVLAASKDDWRPVDPADLALKAPVVEKDADAEALFWDVSVADEIDGGTPRTVLNHYIRIKVFTERGRESQSKIDIVFSATLKSKTSPPAPSSRTVPSLN
jgi:hypothetical protein